jgi:uncharacterized alpha-E superfamily protein
MLSRVADSLYWMARYLERAEHTTRLLDANIQLMLELKPTAVERQLRRINQSLGEPLKLDSKLSVPALEHALIFDPRNKASIISCILMARENARQVREQISSEMWSELNSLYHFVKRYDADDLEQDLPLEFLNEVRRNISLFKGETDATMSHGEEWWFMQIGRHIERAVITSTLLKVHAAELCGEADVEHLELLALLRSCNAFEAYLKRYTAEFSAENIIEFLLLNPQHPHAILFSLRRLEASLAALPDVSVRGQRARVERIAGRLVAGLSYSNVEEILSAGLRSTLDNIIRQCAQMHSAIYQSYIDYAIETSLPA